MRESLPIIENTIPISAPPRDKNKDVGGKLWPTSLAIGTSNLSVMKVDITCKGIKTSMSETKPSQVNEVRTKTTGDKISTT